MNSLSFVVLLFALVNAERSVWEPSPYPIAFRPNATATISVSLICPNGVKLSVPDVPQSKNSSEIIFAEVDPLDPNFDDCVSSFQDETNGLVGLEVLSGSLGYNVTATETNIFRKNPSSRVSGIIFYYLQSRNRTSVIFLGPGCGDGIRQDEKGEQCDNKNTTNCIYCGCVGLFFDDLYTKTNNYCVLKYSSGDTVVTVIVPSIVVPFGCVVILGIALGIRFSKPCKECMAKQRLDRLERIQRRQREEFQLRNRRLDVEDPDPVTPIQAKTVEPQYHEPIENSNPIAQPIKAEYQPAQPLQNYVGQDQQLASPYDNDNSVNTPSPYVNDNNVPVAPVEQNMTENNGQGFTAVYFPPPPDGAFALYQ